MAAASREQRLLNEFIRIMTMTPGEETNNDEEKSHFYGLPQPRALTHVDADYLLFWKEAEQVLQLSRQCPLSPLPWESLPERGTVCIAIARGAVKLVAGMLFVENHFLLDGMRFAPPLALSSPTQEQDVTCVQYTPLEVEGELVCFRRMKGSFDITLMRFRVDYPNRRHQSVTSVGDELIKARTAVGREAEFLAHLSTESDRKRFLMQPKKALDRAADLLLHSYTSARLQQKFRRCILRVRSAAYTVKRFLRLVLLRKRLATAATIERWKLFEPYALSELSQLTTSNYPAICASLSRLTSPQRDAAVAQCVRDHRLEYLKPRRYSAGRPLFTFLVSLPEMCEKVVTFLDLHGVAESLKVRGSMLPRESMIALQRSTSAAFNVNILAARRVRSVLLDLAACFTANTSYAERTPSASPNTSLIPRSTGTNRRSRRLSYTNTSPKGRLLTTVISITNADASDDGDPISDFGAVLLSRFSGATQSEPLLSPRPPTSFNITAPAQLDTATPPATSAAVATPNKTARPTVPPKPVLQWTHRSPIPQLLGTRTALCEMLATARHK